MGVASPLCFKLSESGNDAEIDLSEDEAYSFEPKKKKTTKKKPRVASPQTKSIKKESSEDS